MKKVADYLEKNGAPPEIRINPEEVFLQYYIDKAAITRLINISMQDDFAQYGVFFGLEDPETQKPPHDPTASFGRPTACFLGLDKYNNILGCHFPKIPVGSNVVQVIDGEDTRPPSPPPGAAEEGAGQESTPENQFTLTTDAGTLDTYFNVDGEGRQRIK
ncbi:hypothetical protein ACQ86N_39240 [Puia sp. P3]|uniref:hypothetical protein n=1 Tax=Puia sp. P3 TaxID=3423952 RepID=UPI003D6779BC